MGIDVYLKWEGISKKELAAQITGFSITSGHLGYLRSSYGWSVGIEIMHRLFNWNWDQSYRKFIEKDELTKNIEKIKDLIESIPEKEVRESFYNFVKLAESKLNEDLTVWVEISY